ncbi:MAG TPA: hypothetical protein PLD23_06460 [Armatimonadota bacterium]|nr:hypothetical protein [Armatimonadota bacterium]HQK93127.1 hypothetical protein [Armatimonadota bacterium]
MRYQPETVARLLASLALLAPLASAAGAQPAASVAIDASRPVGPIGELYNVGYDGWGDITNTGMVAAFCDLGVKYCRLVIDLSELCGDAPGDYHWDYARPRDVGLGFTDQVRKVIANGWTPLLAFSYHSGAALLPRWFHGEHHDANQRVWARYNRDGSPATEGWGDQLGAATGIARDVAAHLAGLGLTGLHWETIYEMGHDMPLVEVHHAVAEGLREADPTCVIAGPATWPGWTVEERFVKPYLAKYGPDLLDRVSVHWYGSNDHEVRKLWEGEPEDWVPTMARRDCLAALLERTKLFGDWTRSLHALLTAPQLNPQAKAIGIIFTEVDVDATSYYMRNPVNDAWPEYRAEADCWLNTNSFGGVWWASVLCHIASAGVAADAAKFTARYYYGLAEMAPDDRAYRYPVWFALRLLREQGGLTSGRQMLQVSCEATAQTEAFATGGPGDLRAIVINKVFTPQSIRLSVSGLAAGNWQATRYVFDETRVARFLGRKPGEEADGLFEGAPTDDSLSARCLEPVDTVPCAEAGGFHTLADFQCPPLSFTVLRFEAAR